MKCRVVLPIILVVTLTIPAATALEFVMHGPSIRFDTGYNTISYRQDTIRIGEDPKEIQERVQSFDHDLRTDFWRDDEFHPFIFQRQENFEPCGRYPTRECIRLNEYGGFVRAANSVPEDFKGYGAYERLSIEDGKLYPIGTLRDRIVQQNLNKIESRRSVHDRTRRMPQQRQRYMGSSTQTREDRRVRTHVSHRQRVRR